MMSKSAMIYVTCASLGKDRWANSRYDGYIKLLPGLFHDRINRYLNWQDRQRSIIGKLLVKKSLSYVGIPTGLMEYIKFTEFGKPYFSGRFNFNISHAGDFIICAVAMDLQIGIDIEKVSPVNPDEFREIMNDEQREKIMNSENPDIEFFKFWTVKEAVAKAAGNGLSVAFDKIETDFSTAWCNGTEWYLKEIMGVNEHRAFIATDVFVEKIEMVFLNEFI